MATVSINFEQLAELIERHKPNRHDDREKQKCRCGVPIVRDEAWARHVAEEVVREFGVKPTDR